MAASSPTAAGSRKTRYRAVTHPKTSAPAEATRHLLSRFTYGWTPALGKQVQRAGGVEAWFAKQLSGAYPDTWYTTTRNWWPSMTRSTEDLWERHRNDTENIWWVTADYARWCLLRRIGSERQVLEVMTDFWENYLHIPVHGEGYGFFRASYGETIRAHALGRFEDMLIAATTHPAMGVYLSNAYSTKRAPNENLGRELLELHTVGHGSGYTEDDVKNSARILTGWRVDGWRTWRVWYEPADHWTGPVRVLDFADANAEADGREVTRRYLSYLANHPATARRVARKLAIRFVSDEPSQNLIDALAKVYLDNGTAIVPVVRALVAHPEFKSAAWLKLRTPEEDLVATYRALGAKITSGGGREDAAAATLWQASNIGATPFGWPRPDGRPDRAEAWATPSRFLGSLDVHYSMAGGWWPKNAITYRTPTQWLPAKQVRFDLLVDHLSRTMTGLPSTDKLLRVCCEAAEVRPETIINAQHPLVKWTFPRLLTVFLDQPAHLNR